MLPKVTRPEYSTTIPSTGKKIKYQPFSVKEEKILVLAAESQEQDEISNAITNILQNCVTSPSDFKVSELALFDIEYLFLKARSKSAGEKIELIVTDPDDESFRVDHSINVDKIGVVRSEDHTDLIEVEEGVQIKMRYPDITFFTEGVDINNISQSIATVGRCISSIVHGDEVFNRGDMSDQELQEWLEGMTSSQFKKIMHFFESMPRLEHSFTLKNTNTGKNFTITLRGLSDFF